MFKSINWTLAGVTLAIVVLFTVVVITMNKSSVSTATADTMWVYQVTGSRLLADTVVVHTKILNRVGLESTQFHAESFFVDTSIQYLDFEFSSSRKLNTLPYIPTPPYGTHAGWFLGPNLEIKKEGVEIPQSAPELE